MRSGGLPASIAALESEALSLPAILFLNGMFSGEPQCKKRKKKTSRQGD